MTRTAIIAGVGPGLGESIARRFIKEGCRVGLFARSEDYLAELSAELGENALPIPTDITDPDSVAAGFEAVREAFGPVDVLVNHASAASWSGLLDSSVAEFESAWAVGGRGAFVCSQEAVGDMLETGGGTVLFTGATSAVRSLGGTIGFAATKFAARGMAMDMAQEFGPEGIHVAHVVIDGQIGGPDASADRSDRGSDTFLDPDRMAETYWHLVEQDDPSTQPFEVHITNGPRNTEFL